MEMKRFCNESESNRVVYPYKEQYYAAGINGSNNADVGSEKCEDIRKNLASGFDVYVNGRLIYFPSSKAKEMLAVLVEKRGSSVSLSQMTYLLYESIEEKPQKQPEGNLLPLTQKS